MRPMRLILFLMTSLVAVSPLACSSGVDPGSADEPVAGPAHAAALAEAKAVYLEAMVECLRSYGLAVSVDEDARGIEGKTPPGMTSEEYLAHFGRCEEELVALRRIDAPAQPTADYFAGAYDYYLTVKGCLERLGFVVPDPPSKDAYIESQGTVWFPYENVRPSAVGHERWEEINMQCPQEYRPY